MAFGRRIKAWWRRITTPPPASAGKHLGRWEYKTVLVEVSPSLDDEQRAALRDAIAFWNSKCHALFFWSEGGLKAEIGYPARDGVVTVASHPPVGGPEVVATTELFFRDHPGGLIRGAHIEVRPAIKGERLRLALGHELGHVLGLGHTLNPLDHLMGITSGGWLLLDEELLYVMEGR